MPYNDADKSFVPPTFNEILQIVVEQWNAEFGTNYDEETLKERTLIVLLTFLFKRKSSSRRQSLKFIQNFRLILKQSTLP